MRTRFSRPTAIAMAGVFTAVVGAGSAHAQAGVPALKDVFKDAFRVGAALSPRQFDEQDARAVALIDRQFNTITPENVLKWEAVHPQPGVYEFGPSDRYVAFGERHGMFIIGHTLAWHSQVPRWVFQDSSGQRNATAALLQRLHDHSSTVVGRHKGRLKGWDVVNEALNEDGTLRNSLWLQIAGPEFIEKAFIWAHEADPAAELYYNDYSLENPEKRAGCVRLIQRLLDKGIKVTAVGMQDHLNMTFPTVAAEDSTIEAFTALGVHVNITELDIDVLPRGVRGTSADVSLRGAANPALNPYVDSLPDSVQQQLAQRYEEMFRVFMKYQDKIDRVTFWGVTDGDSWLNGWPIPGRTSYPLLFDRKGQPKPAFNRVVALAVAPAPQQLGEVSVVDERKDLARRDRNQLTGEELTDKDFNNVYEALEALRPFWLRARGPSRLDASSEVTAVRVYVNGLRVGSVDELRAISPKTIRRVMFMSGPDAQARFGVGNENGAVVVETLGDKKAP